MLLGSAFIIIIISGHISCTVIIPNNLIQYSIPPPYKYINYITAVTQKFIDEFYAYIKIIQCLDDIKLVSLGIVVYIVYLQSPLGSK